jgi:hypothetical protein
MARTILDAELRRWEVFASAGPHGFAAPAHLVFRCISDRDQVSRIIEVEGDKSDAEAQVETQPSGELLQLLDEARPLS